MKKSWLKDIKGMWVATYTEGRMLGVINTIYIDPDTKQLTGFALRSGTPLGGQEVWVTTKNIKKIGEDLIFLYNIEALGNEPPLGKKLVQLVGMQVSSKDGRVLGQLSDVAVNIDNWEMIDILLVNNGTIALDLSETVLGKDFILIQSGAEVVEKVREKKASVVDSVFGKDFIKQTSDAIKRVLKGNEIDSPEKKREDEKEVGQSSDLKEDE